MSMGVTRMPVDTSTKSIAAVYKLSCSRSWSSRSSLLAYILLFLLSLTTCI
jgi:hypothetical protein